MRELCVSIIHEEKKSITYLDANLWFCYQLLTDNLMKLVSEVWLVYAIFITEATTELHYDTLLICFLQFSVSIYILRWGMSLLASKYTFISI